MLLWLKANRGQLLLTPLNTTVVKLLATGLHELSQSKPNKIGRENNPRVIRLNRLQSRFPENQG